MTVTTFYYYNALMHSPSAPDSYHKKYVDSLSPDEREAYEKARRSGELVGRFGAMAEVNKELTRKKFEAEWRADHDQLTGLLTKPKLKEIVNKRIKEASKTPGKFGLFFADLTNFKKANDVLGHERVDKLLAGFGDRLARTLRTEKPGQEVHLAPKRPDGPDYIAYQRKLGHDDETAARYGGDEFAGLVDLTDPQESEVELSPEDRLTRVGDRVQRAFLDFIAEQEPAVRGLGLDLSIGGAVWGEGMTTEDLFTAADKNMTAHKEEQHKMYGSYRPN